MDYIPLNPPSKGESLHLFSKKQSMSCLLSLQNRNPSNISIYNSIPSSISATWINSSAEWDRVLSPGPNFKDWQGKHAWSDRVGEPYVLLPSAIPDRTRGWFLSIEEELRRKER